MASLGHVAVGMVAGRLASRGAARGTSGALVFRMFALSAASLLPDADVIAFQLGIPYGAPFGHRGASHSFVAALLIGILAGILAAQQARPRAGLPRGQVARDRGLRVALYVALVVATHGPLDALTDGGLGVALLWPFSHERFFFPWTPIPVAPIGIRMVSSRGLLVASTELLYFAPLFLYALWGRGARSEGH